MNDNKSIYKLYIDAWFLFYKNTFGRAPKHGGAESKALKSIIAYMNDLVSGDEERSYNGWLLLLNSWDEMPEFYRNNTDLKMIECKINILLNELKRITKGDRKKCSGISREYMEGIFKDLYAK
jgi:hypothetical protein